MSLRVWLPLTGDLRNNGLSNTTITNNGAVVDDNGKIGKCYKFVSSSSTESSYLQLDHNFMTSFTECSVCFWLKIVAWNTNFATFFQAGLGGQPYSNYIFGILRYGGNSNICLSISDGTNSSTDSCRTSSTFSTNTWYHLTCTYSNGHCKIYINGELNKDYTTSIIPAFSSISRITVGKCNNKTAYQSSCMMNDLRIYDHALSLKEIKEIAKGLVCHYNLCDPYSTENLIQNGFGEGGNANWSGVSVSTDDLPTTDPNIKAKFTGAGENIDYIPINVNHSYTVSMYIKRSTTTTGTRYPGFRHYDSDKKFINAYNSEDGFNNTYKTTLAQPLKKGDTVIYATNLSTWTTDTNYYFHVAIFGYKNSDGYTYPDMIYTADSPAFGTRTDKSNIDKTNNTVTLLAPFEGEDRPAGTTICQATAGGAFYYPFGGIDISTIEDWTYKTATFKPANVKKLKACKYLRFKLDAYSCYLAGIKLVDNTNNAVVYDSSGYNNHGEIYAYNAKGNIVTSSDTPRNSISTFINSDDNTTNTASGTVFIYGNCKLETPRQLTIAFWCKPIAGYFGGTGQGQFCTTDYDKGMSAGRDYNSTAMHHRDGTIDVTNIDGTDKRLSIVFTANEWHHYAFVYDGRYCRSYRDGVEQSSIDMGTEISLKSFKAIVIGYSNAGGVYRSNKSYYSDFRVYTTAISVYDILELYHTPISIAKTGETFTQGEYIET